MAHEQSNRARFVALALIAAAFLAHIAAYQYIQVEVGTAVGILISVPIMTAAWFFGICGGLIATAIGVTINLTLASIVADIQIGDWLRTDGYFGAGALVLVSPGLGRLSDLEAERRASNQEMQRLNWRLAETKEEQSKLIARELHDEIGQHLTGLKLQLEVADEDAIQAARQITRNLMSRVRDLLTDLSPTVLDDLGLEPALHSQFAHLKEPTSLNVIYHSQGLGTRLDSPIETAAYRIIQEALTNVARHARTGETRVDVVLDTSELSIVIEDHGRGMERAHGRRSSRQRIGIESSTGIAGMRERARSVGGRFEVRSEPGSVTRVFATLPRSLNGTPAAAESAATGAPAVRPVPASQKRISP
jgi:signal transduction histidine kinase